MNLYSQPASRSFMQKKALLTSLSAARHAVTHAKMPLAVNAKCLMQYAHHAEALQRFLSVPVKTALFIAASALQK